ncbi:sugar-phosphatase [Carnobacterium alterfunditum]|uniref:sugar-phosphatase n=1 Tax=Carnobacterium alterfunditum TaxID=28230 RepID=UPI003593539B
MTIELIAIDLDGTLLTPERKISAKVKETIEMAKTKGIKIVLCTGRPLPGVFPILEALNLEEEGDYVITYNGALVQQSHNGKAIAHHTLSYDNFLEIEAMSRQVGSHCHTIDETHIYTANKDISPYSVRESSLVNMPIRYRTVEEMDPTLEISKMMMIDEPDILDAAIAKLPKSFYAEYTILKSEPFYLEVLNKSASKGQALKDLARILDIPKENIMAIGDNENDIDMIQYAGMGVAMGNAVASVKEVSDYITDTNEYDGVATAIEAIAFENISVDNLSD